MVSYNKHRFLLFITHLLITSAVIWLIALYPVYLYVPSSKIVSSLAGFVLSLFNAVGGYMINNYAINQPAKKFMAIILGGMCIRLFLLLVALGLLIEFTSLDSLYVISSLFIFYIVFITIEILSLHRIQKQQIN